MTDTEELARRELSGLDPHQLMDREADRIDGFLDGLDDDGWRAPTACVGWDRRELVAHLISTDDYFQAGLEDRMGAFFEAVMAEGGHDLDSFNEVGVRRRAGLAPADLLEQWHRSQRDTRRMWREHGTAPMGTSVGPYPAEWQAFHAAAEWATHADDLGVPVTDDEAAARTAWRVRVSRFALGEAKADLEVEPVPGGTRVTGQGVDLVVADEDLVAAVSARLPAGVPLDDAARAVLSTLP